MTDPDDGVIRLHPTKIDLGVFDAHTSLGIVEAPILVLEDERFGPVHILLNPADGAVFQLTDLLVSYVTRLMKRHAAAQEDTEPQEEEQ